MNSGRCRTCYNAHMRKYMRDRHRARKDYFAEKAGRRCAACARPVGLNFEFDHKNPDDKSFSMSLNLSKLSIKKLEAEFRKCQVLCTQCHREKTRNDHARLRGVKPHWEHGTLSGYRYCKCPECKKAKSAYSREYNRRNPRARATPKSE